MGTRVRRERGPAVSPWHARRAVSSPQRSISTSLCLPTPTASVARDGRVVSSEVAPRSGDRLGSRRQRTIAELLTAHAHPDHTPRAGHKGSCQITHVYSRMTQAPAAIMTAAPS